MHIMSLCWWADNVFNMGCVVDSDGLFLSSVDFYVAVRKKNRKNENGQKHFGPNLIGLGP